MKKILILFICIVAGLVLGNWVISHKDNLAKNITPSKVAIATPMLSSTQSVVGIIPTRLTIPKIDVAAQVESVGMDSEGRMDVPREDNNAAWYNLGFKPGENGSAVIDGHFDKASGQPAVFNKLSLLKSGDTIAVTDDTGHTVTFVVEKLAYYDFDKFPLQEVFNTTDVPRLNLITCDGAWNTTTKNYSKRLVVYSKLDPSL